MSGKARDIRRMAFQALYQFDVRGEQDVEAIRGVATDDLTIELTPAERDEALELAHGAYADRLAADDAIAKLAPTWPAHRQPAVDRAILRLAHYEMMTGRGNPKAAINDAIELAKEFSTERSPAFVNGVLDKVLKTVQANPPARRGKKPAGKPTMDPDLAAELGLDGGAGPTGS